MILNMTFLRRQKYILNVYIFFTSMYNNNTENCRFFEAKAFALYLDRIQASTFSIF